MAKRQPVKCRVCNGSIDRDKETDWINPKTNMFYHTSCYNDYEKKKQEAANNLNLKMEEEEFWLEIIWEYLTRDLKIGPNFAKLKKQFDSFVKKRMTPKGIYFTLRYFYEKKGGDPTKAEGGIGIVPYLYEEGTQYWAAKDRERKEICEKINAEIEAMLQKSTKTVRISRKKQSSLLNIKDISNMIEAEED